MKAKELEHIVQDRLPKPDLIALQNRAENVLFVLVSSKTLCIFSLRSEGSLRECWAAMYVIWAARVSWVLLRAFSICVFLHLLKLAAASITKMSNNVSKNVKIKVMLFVMGCFICSARWEYVWFTQKKSQKNKQNIKLHITSVTLFGIQPGCWQAEQSPSVRCPLTRAKNINLDKLIVYCSMSTKTNSICRQLKLDMSSVLRFPTEKNVSGCPQETCVTLLPARQRKLLWVLSYIIYVSSGYFHLIPLGVAKADCGLNYWFSIVITPEALHHVAFLFNRASDWHFNVCVF